MSLQLIADSGATKCEWCISGNGASYTFFTAGISPYFLDESQINTLLQTEVLPQLHGEEVSKVHFYGTGLGDPTKAALLQAALQNAFSGAEIHAATDILGAARALCGNAQGIACILGTGSNSCYYDGEKIVKSNPSLGYILGDEGSGAYLGKKVLQYYLYNTFDEELKAIFAARFAASRTEALDNLYKKPFPNRYLAGFALFLAENRGHYMIENILEDGLNDFFLSHVYKYTESWTLPVNFIGSIAFGFKDVLQELCNSYELELGTVLKTPVESLVKYHALPGNNF